MKLSSNKLKADIPASRTTINAFGITDPGRTRDHNEDTFSISDDLGLFIVSDGIGGHRGGEIASKIVVEALPYKIASALSESSRTEENQKIGILRNAIGDLSKQIYLKGSEVHELQGMGATVVACLISKDIATIAHLGDSRIYLLRKGAFEQLTEDHTISQLLLLSGQINKRQAKKHPTRNVLTRYVGMESTLEPETALLELQDGDRLVLCSDGLTNEITNRQIGEMLCCEADIKKVCKKLVDAANAAGGKDNITAMVIQYGGSEYQYQSQTVVLSRKIGRSLRKKKHISQ